jgi:hypothetical protein
MVRRPKFLINGHEMTVPTKAMAYYHQQQYRNVPRSTHQAKSHVECLISCKAGLLEEVNGVSLKYRPGTLLRDPGSNGDFGPTKVDTFEAFEVTHSMGEFLLVCVGLGEQGDRFLGSRNVELVGWALEATYSGFGFGFPAVLDDLRVRRVKDTGCMTYAR